MVKVERSLELLCGDVELLNARVQGLADSAKDLRDDVTNLIRGANQLSLRLGEIQAAIIEARRTDAP